MSNRAADALVALRQIQRKIELDSRQLAQHVQLTPSQLKVLQLLLERGTVSAGEIAKDTKLSNATITTLVDKMAARGLVARTRCETDRRKVWLELTSEGAKAIQSAPINLQKAFETRFEAMEPWEQTMLVSALERVSLMLEAETLEVAPILTVGEIGQKPRQP